MSEEKRIGGGKVFTRANLVLGGLALSFIFQTGYFRFLGIEFFSFMSINKLIINTGALIPVAYSSLFWVKIISEDFTEKVSQGNSVFSLKFFRIFDVPFRSRNRVIVTAKLLIFVTYLLLSINYFGAIAVGKVAIVILLVYLAISFGLVVIWEISSHQHEFDKHGTLNRSDLITSAILLIIFSYVMGFAFASNLAGEECIIVKDKQESQITLYTSVEFGILGKNEAGTVFVNYDSIDTISCHRTTKTN